jgi:hypothetical protein
MAVLQTAALPLRHPAEDAVIVTLHPFKTKPAWNNSQAGFSKI